MNLRTCRFCGLHDNSLVHYSVRSYAHPACLFRAKGENGIASLHEWQIRTLPVLPLVEAGLLFERLVALQDAAKAKYKARR